MAYHIKKDASPKKNLPYLPKILKLPSGENVILDRASADDEPNIYEMYRYAVEEEGDSYPYYEVGGMEGFQACYMSKDTFVIRRSDSGRCIGSFYVKPNYPGRSSHIANGGFLVDPDFRRMGIGTLMGKAMLPLARDVGYRAVMFNLVYVTNIASLKTWRKVGYREIGRIPKAGQLEGTEGYTDCIQFYYDLTDIPAEYELSGRQEPE